MKILKIIYYSLLRTSFDVFIVLESISLFYMMRLDWRVIDFQALVLGASIHIILFSVFRGVLLQFYKQESLLLSILTVASFVHQHFVYLTSYEVIFVTFFYSIIFYLLVFHYRKKLFPELQISKWLQSIPLLLFIILLATNNIIAIQIEIKNRILLIDKSLDNTSLDANINIRREEDLLIVSGGVKANKPICVPKFDLTDDINSEYFRNDDSHDLFSYNNQLILTMDDVVVTSHLIGTPAVYPDYFSCLEKGEVQNVYLDIPYTKYLRSVDQKYFTVLHDYNELSIYIEYFKATEEEYREGSSWPPKNGFYFLDKVGIENAS